MTRVFFWWQSEGKLVAPDPLALPRTTLCSKGAQCLQGWRGSLAGGGRPVSAKSFFLLSGNIISGLRRQKTRHVKAIRCFTAVKENHDRFNDISV